MSESKVRQFKVPKLNFKVTKYHKMIKWNSESIQATSLPIYEHLSDADLKQLITAKEKRMDHFPCHTQAVSRAVKLVTEAASMVCGNETRDGFIRAKLHTRKLHPTAA